MIKYLTILAPLLVASADAGPDSAAKPASPADSFVIRETTTREVAGHSITLNRIKPPLLPSPRENTQKGIMPAPLQDVQKAQPLEFVHINAAVVAGGRASRLTWTYNGKDYSAWSNIDFNFAARMEELQTGNGKLMAFVTVTNLPAAPGPGSAVPLIPDSLPKEFAQFIPETLGDSEPAAFAAVQAVHDHYRANAPALHAAAAERARAHQDSLLQPQDKTEEQKRTTLYFWRKPPPSQKKPGQPANTATVSRQNAKGGAK